MAEGFSSVAQAPCRVDCTFPQSFLLFLQSAPPTVVLNAFRSDCETRGVAWCSPEAQMLAVEWFVQHPLVLKYPPRRRMVRTLLKMYVTAVEEQYDADCTMLCTSGEGPVQADLMEEFIRLSVLGDTCEQSFCFKTFYNSFVDVSDIHRTTNTPSVTETRRGLEEFSVIRVSCEQFSNVGLALWPAAFVMAQLLAQELKGQTRMLADVLGLPSAASSMRSTHAPSVPHTTDLLTTSTSLLSDSLHHCSPCSWNSGDRSSRGVSPKLHNSRLRILELGAGAGLTPVYLHRMEEYKQHVESFFATDYQEIIVENMRLNMMENGIDLTSDCNTPSRDLNKGRVPPLHQAAVLDWLDHDDNERMFMENGIDVIVMADCIYDASVIPALVDTIYLALTVRGVASSMTEELRSSMSEVGGGDPSAAGAPRKQRCCIVVQTHRQHTTMHKFFSAVSAFGDVRSYTLVRQVAKSLRISEDYSGTDGGCIPIGGWDRETLLLQPDRVVCALIPDVILEDGSMRSSSSQLPSQCVNEVTVAEEDCSTHRLSRSTRCCTSLGALGVASAVEDDGRPSSLNTSPNRTDLHTPSSRRAVVDSASEAAAALLADEMIGPFYTSMVGLIGVHVVTLKPEHRTS